MVVFIAPNGEKMSKQFPSVYGTRGSLFLQGGWRGCHLPQKKAFVFNTKIWKWKIIIMLSNKMKYQINALVHDKLKKRLICFKTKRDKAMSKSF